MTEREYQTPCYIIDEEKLLRDFNLLKDSLEASWNHYRIGYSFKTNSLPWLVTFLKEKGVMAEVVSDDEYALARWLAFKESEIIYNGPVKERTSFERALLAGGIVNLDGRRELDWLEELCDSHPDREFSVGIRVNFNLERLCPGETTMGEEGGRFGFSYENGTFGRVVERLRRRERIHITGLHLHSSSKSRSVAIFEAISSMACRLKREFDLDLSYVDLGGGYCGGLPGRPQYPDYFPAIAAVLKEEFSPEQTALIVEPGISLLSSATTFETRVLDVRDIGDKRYLITDGSRFQLDPTMIKSSYLYHFKLASPKEGRRQMESQCISGYSCMEVDRIFELENGPELKEGDRIVYENVGGYTMSLPEQDKSYNSKLEMLDELVVLLGGRIAESLTMGDISTGASNDIERASDIARKMVTRYGMSDDLGPITYGDTNDEVFIGRDYGHVKNYSEETAAKIDEEVYRIVENAYKRCEDILKTHMDQLHLVAGELLKREKLTGEQFELLMTRGYIDEPQAEEAADAAPDQPVDSGAKEDAQPDTAQADEKTDETPDE